MTISQKDYDKIKGNPNLTVIGYIKEKNAGTNLVLRDDSVVQLLRYYELDKELRKIQ